MDNHKRVIICGAGVIGASIAYHLTLRGVKPLIIEQVKPACSASGKAGGFLAKDWSKSSALGPLSQLSFELHEQIAKKFKEEFGVDFGYRKMETLAASVIQKQKQNALNHKQSELVPGWLDTSVTSVSKLGDTTTTAQVHPGLFTNALIQQSLRNGAELKIGTVEGVVTKDKKITGVRVDGSVIDSDVVIIAMGVWSTKACSWFSLPPLLFDRVHSIVISPKESVTGHALFLSYESEKGERLEPEVYPRPDGEVYICGVGDDEPVPPRADQITLKENACNLLYSVATAISSKFIGAPITAKQVCYIPISSDGLPLIGKLPDVEGGYIATGHSCWGILNSTGTGLAMAELIVDGKAKCVSLDPFDPCRLSK